MFSFKKFFHSNKRTVPVGKAQKEILECFISNKPAFDHWHPSQPATKISFKFYYPTAVDFYFDDIKLFTAYFKKNLLDQLELQELKMSEDNFRTIGNTVWKPFEEVMLQFLNNLDETQKLALFQKRKALYEYAEICKGTGATSIPEAYQLVKQQVQ
jgi:hypothetical protein